MTRSGVKVRSARHDDLPSLVDLWRELQETAKDPLLGRARLHDPVDDVVRARLDTLVDNPLARVIVAESRDGALVGMAVLAAEHFGEFFEVAAVHLSHLIVRADHRRRGVGHVLLSAAAGYAEDNGIDQIVVSVPPTSREAHRFFARLGFVPLVSRRVVAVGLLRRRLADGGSRLDALVRRRTILVRRRGEVRGTGATMGESV